MSADQKLEGSNLGSAVIFFSSRKLFSDMGMYELGASVSSPVLSPAGAPAIYDNKS